MQIELRESNVGISDELALHVRRRIEIALRHLGDRVDRATVHLVAIDGPKGVREKHCRITARFWATNKRVAVEATDADAYVAVSQAAARLEEKAAALSTAASSTPRVRP